MLSNGESKSERLMALVCVVRHPLFSVEMADG